MKIVEPSEIPEFKNVSCFAKWYLENDMPLLLPAKQEIFVSDDATAVCLFRHGRYQFEMYLIHPNPVIPLHEHPGVENIEITAPLIKNKNLNFLMFLQKEGVAHGPGIKKRAEENGFLLFSAQRWEEGLEISTIGARWKGYTAGPKHESIIKRFSPDCLIYPGYADVTKKNNFAAIL